MLSMVSLQDMTARGGKFGDVHHIRRGGKTSNIQDVRWHPIKIDVIACSASNGQVMLWNVTRGRAGAHSLIWESRGHDRTVWRLAWCQPGNEIFMLSGSLDGTIRMWDARASCKAVMEMSINKQQVLSSLPRAPPCSTASWVCLSRNIECALDKPQILRPHLPALCPLINLW